MDAKDITAALGLGATFLVSTATLVHSIWSSKQSFFVNTVTTSRLKWIDSLRDKVAEFIAVTTGLSDTKSSDGEKSADSLLLQRDTLLHQIVLHLNPHDPEDQKIKVLVDHVKQVTVPGIPATELTDSLVHLRDATADYLKKEWNRVKNESAGHRA